MALAVEPVPSPTNVASCDCHRQKISFDLLSPLDDDDDLTVFLDTLKGDDEADHFLGLDDPTG